jgi:raffinose/stachyose/melibiose transport system permease protein
MPIHKRRSGYFRLPKAALAGYLMVLPTMLLFAVFVLYPVVSTCILSFYKWPGIGPREFVGFANYFQAFADSIFRQAFWNNVVYSVGIILFGVLPGLILAAILARNIRGRLFFQTVFFFPRLMTMVIVSVIWSWIYNPHFGLLNKIIQSIGFKDFALGWLGHPQLAIWAVIWAGGWTYFGFCMVIFLAALQNTDPFLYDAALIDGASSVQIFIHVTIPQIAHVLTMVLVYTVIDSFKVFDIIYIMTRGGPGNKTQIMATYLYQESFRHNYFGYGATISVLLTIFVLTVAGLFQHFREKEA